MKVRFAVIGTNFITDHMLEAAKDLEEFELAAVYSRTEDRAKEFAAKYGVEKTYTDLERLAADPDIDAVYVASPSAFHEEQSVMMLGAGKHVLCEKPIAPDLETLDRMLAAAEKNGKILMEAMIPVHVPGFSLIKEKLPMIGKVRRAVINYCRFSSRYDNYRHGIVENAFRKELFNGALMDMGCYPLHICAGLFGRPDRIVSSGFFLPDGGIDAEGTVTETYSDMLVDVQYSKVATGPCDGRIYGEEGVLIFDDIHPPKKVTVIGRTGGEWVFEAEKDLKPMGYEVRDFISQIKNGPDPVFTEYSRITAEVIGKTRRTVGIDFGLTGRQ